MQIIVTGATGMVGSEVVRQALIDPAITLVTELVRKPLSISNQKLKNIIHQDFKNYNGLEDMIKQHDACVWALGISQAKVKSDDEYHRITYDYTIAAANAILHVNPGMTFLFVSGEGADTTMNSKTLFARVKGETENVLNKLAFKKLYIIRPGMIKAVEKNPGAVWYEHVAYKLFPFFRLNAPKFTITSVELVRDILHIIKHGESKKLLRNADLYKMAKQKI